MRGLNKIAGGRSNVINSISKTIPPKVIDNWPFYIQQKVEPRNYDDSVKNDEDFDVSSKLNITCKLQLFFPLFTSFVRFPAFYKGITSYPRVLSRLILLLRRDKVQSSEVSGISLC